MPGAYIKDQRAEQLQHMPVAKCANHFCWRVPAASEMFRFVEYFGKQDVLSGLHGFTNVVTNDSRFAVHEMVDGDELWKNDRRQMVRPELKSM